MGWEPGMSVCMEMGLGVRETKQPRTISARWSTVPQQMSIKPLHKKVWKEGGQTDRQTNRGLCSPSSEKRHAATLLCELYDEGCAWIITEQVLFRN